jgi:putative membrane protein
MTTAEDDRRGTVGDDSWRRLSPWAMLQFAFQAGAGLVRITLFAVVAAMFGAARSNRDLMYWLIPVVLMGLALVSAVLGYFFYRFRITSAAVHVRQGWLHRRHLELALDRIQNISIEEPFYYRLLGLVTLKIDGAGSTSEEVRIAAIPRDEAEAIRAFIKARRTSARGVSSAFATGSEGAGAEAAGGRFTGGEAAATLAAGAELRFTRSLGDLVIHGLTNNRAFIVIASLFGLMSQTNLSPTELIKRLGIDFDVLIAGMSMVRLAVLIALSFLLATGVLALLSVFGSIATYYGFSLYRTGNGILVKRGLLTRHEIHVEKSRIQSIALRQDWLDYLLGRRNVLLEPIAHAPVNNDNPAAAAILGKRILVPSVRLHETEIVTDEVLRVRPESLRYASASKRLFYKYAVLFSVLYAVYLAGLLVAQAWWLVAAVTVLWILHTALLRMNWKRKGLAIDGDIIVVRSGVIGVNYAIFPALKLQRVTHVQSLLMRRRHLSTLVFNTGSTTARMPHVDTRLASSVIDYCLYAVESGRR